MADGKREIWFVHWNNGPSQPFRRSGPYYDAEEAVESADGLNQFNQLCAAEPVLYVPAVPEVAAEAGKAQAEWHLVPDLPLPDGEVDLPDSDVWVLVMAGDGSDYVIARLEFTDDSEGHGEPYWETPGGDLALCNYPFWRHLQLPAEAGQSEAWVSVEERLPDSALTEVLVTLLPAQSETVEFTVATWHGNYWIGDVDVTWDTDEVTHWMPLPSPPKGDR